MVDRNLTAANMALELLAWDKSRASLVPGPGGREGLIARGAECYARLLHSLHGEGGDPDEDSSGWLDESYGMRADRDDMSRRRIFRRSVANVGEMDLSRLDRVHPEWSYTGPTGIATLAAPPSVPASSIGDDWLDRLERLGTLRADGALTDEEFAAAKARLLDG